MNPCYLIPIAVGFFSAFFGYLIGRLLTQNPDSKFDSLINDLEERLSLSQQNNLKKDEEIATISKEVVLYQRQISKVNETEKAYVNAIQNLESQAKLGNQSELNNKLSILQNNILVYIDNEKAYKQHIGMLEQRLTSFSQTPKLEALQKRIDELETENLQSKNIFEQNVLLQNKQKELETIIGNSTINNEEILLSKIADLEIELNSYKNSKIETATVNKSSIETKKADLLIFDTEAAASVFGKKIKQDDLKVIEGIGPKIEELFNKNGIATWKELADTTVDRCKEILVSAGEGFILHNPSTWPRQSEMLSQGKYQELKIWQDKLKAGVEK